MNEINLAKVWRVRRWAESLHGTQKYGVHAYVYHLDAVSSLLVPYGETAVIVGYLHDVLEDTDVSYETLAQAFGERVAHLVKLVSDEPGRNRRERKAATNAKLVAVTATDSLSLVVKAADRLANIRQCVLELKGLPGQSPSDSKISMYRREQTEFRYAVWRAGLCDPLWEEIDSIMDQTPHAP